MSDSSLKLAKFLAHAGVASRRASEQLIAAGKIKVNGQVETNVARRVNPDQDVVESDGKVLSGPIAPMIVLLNKPRGVVSTTQDPDGKTTVLDLLPVELRNNRLYPVGRLDEDSEGLVILTNQGSLAYKLTHPKFQVPRVYQVWVEGNLTNTELNRLRTGIPLKDGRTLPCQAEILQQTDAGDHLEITLTEGRHHQIRRMMQALNHPVERLLRLSHGRYTLDALRPGKHRVVGQATVNAEQSSLS